MSQKIKLQDGKIVYETSDYAFDPSSLIDFGVVGLLNVSHELNVGNDPLVDGGIYTPEDRNLLVEPGTNGDIRLSTTGTGKVVLNNVEWPSNSPGVGKYLGAIDSTTLAFLDFMAGSVPSDVYTPAMLDAAFPDATPGQQVIGDTVVYQKVSTGDWRTFGALAYVPVNKAGDTMTGPLTLENNLELTSGHILKSVDSAVTAAGIDRAGATLLNRDINVVSIAPVGSGVVLPAEAVGLSITVINDTTEEIIVYPNSLLAEIDYIGVATGFFIPAQSIMVFNCVSSTRWFTLDTM